MDKEVLNLAHGGATMSQKTLITGVVTGLIIGAMGTILRAKTGVNV